jgi:RNA polymerase sigma factor (sigma-70 family)
MEDQQLLRDYVARNSDEAFTELVRLHLGLVYSAALRKVGDRSAAEDVTQTVFTLLAQKAPTLGPDVILAGWLYQTACFKAAQHQRAESRRHHREQEAAAMQDDNGPSELRWERIEPLLDDAMQAMSETDRAAILLRFFQQKRLREVGLALGVEEEAARKRVDRALDKLRDWFATRGVAYPSASLAALLSAEAAQAAPAMTAATVSATALKAAAGIAGTAATSLPILAAMKLKHALIAGSILLLGAAVAIYQFTPDSEPAPEPAPVTKTHRLRWRQNQCSRRFPECSKRWARAATPARMTNSVRRSPGLKKRFTDRRSRRARKSILRTTSSQRSQSRSGWPRSRW